MLPVFLIDTKPPRKFRFSWGRSLRALTWLQMDEDFAFSLDTAEMYNIELRKKKKKKISFLLFKRLHNKVVFQGLVGRSSVFHMKRLMHSWWQ